MSELDTLFQQIEALSPASREALAQYVEFLQWQEQQAEAAEVQRWSYSFVETFWSANVHTSADAAGMDVKMAPASVGGETKAALWAHPPLTGQTVLEYHVPVPRQVSDLKLQLAVGIRDGAQTSEENLVAFGVRVNGLRVWSLQDNSQRWQTVDIPLHIDSGDVVRFEFTTEALGDHRWTWAVWGNPELTGVIGQF